MALKRARMGIRTQLTLIVLFGAILSTGATLFVADNAIQSYAVKQAQTQERDNLKIARLVMTTQYGQNISVSSDGKLVVDSPTNGQNYAIGPTSNFGKYQLNNDTDYVDGVKELIGGTISVYQCANAQERYTSCARIATTLPRSGATGTTGTVRDLNVPLDAQIAQHMSLSAGPREWLGEQRLNGTQYFVDYTPLYSPQQNLIGVLSVGVPLDSVTAFQRSTTIELVLLGVIIMVAGVILALLFASAIVNTLQRAARQVSDASERIGSIAAQQAGGSAQQVWAVNAINKALHTFAETAKEIAQRTEQLALMGNQVIQRRSEIAPAQIDSILAYMTRSVRDISGASRQQASQYERMTGAMQAVIEIADQVANSSQHSTESAERLELVVRQLQQLVGVQRLTLRARPEGDTLENMPLLATSTGTITQKAPEMGRAHQPSVQAVRPQPGVQFGGPPPPPQGEMPGGMSGGMPGAYAPYGTAPAQAPVGASGRPLAQPALGRVPTGDRSGRPEGPMAGAPWGGGAYPPGGLDPRNGGRASAPQFSPPHSPLAGERTGQSRGDLAGGTPGSWTHTE